MAIVDEGSEQRNASISPSSSANYTIDRTRVTLIDFPSAGFHFARRQARRIVFFNFFRAPRPPLARAIDSMGRNSSRAWWNTGRRAPRGKMIFATPPFAGCREKTMLHKTLPTMRRLTHRFRDVGNGRAPLLRRREHEDARKSGAYSLHRGEKSEVEPFSEKWVEKVSDCTQHAARVPTARRGDARGKGVDDAGRLLPPPPPPRRAASLSKSARARS